jgi:hypothetical protein
VEDECKTFLDYVNLDTKLRSTIVLHIIGVLSIQDQYDDHCSLGAYFAHYRHCLFFVTGVTTCVISEKDVPRKEKQQQDEDEKDMEEPTNKPEPEPMDEPKSEPVEEPEQPRVTKETNVEDETDKEGGQDEFECYEFSKISALYQSRAWLARNLHQPSRIVCRNPRTYHTPISFAPTGYVSILGNQRQLGCYILVPYTI